MGHRHCDVAVMGAGVFGAWTAYRLAQTGRSVTLVDPFGAAGPRSSSGAESRIIRMGYGGQDLYTRLAQQSLIAWRHLLDGTEAPLFLSTGVLWLANAESLRLAASRDALRRHGIAFEELSGPELERRFPQFEVESGTAAILEQQSGVLVAAAAVRAVVDAAKKAGVNFVQGRHNDIHADTTVYACGAWLPKLFPDLLGEVIVPTRQPLFFFDARQQHFPAWIDDTDERMPYGIPDIAGDGMKLGFHRLGRVFEPDSVDRSATPAEIAEAREYLAKRFPAFGEAPLLATKVCQYENTHSGDFLIDRHPDRPNVWIAGGGSGHGFKHGPAVADYITGLIAGTIAVEPRFTLAANRPASHRLVV